MRRGDYYTGFAPRDGYPRWPSLWSGCICAMCPSLGQTGGSLRDWARGNLGTLTNMDPATDWVLSGGQICLDFDGSNDDVSLATVFPNMTGDVVASISCWIRPASITTTQCVFSFGSYSFVNGGFGLCIGVAAGGNGTFAAGSGNISLDTGGGRGARSGTGVIANTTWQHVAIIKAAGALDTQTSIYVNGKPIALSTSSSSTPNIQSGAPKFGQLVPASANYYNGQTDDLRVYDRVLTANEVMLLATRRGIAYELANKAYTAAADAEASSAPRSKIVSQALSYSLNW